MDNLRKWHICLGLKAGDVYYKRMFTIVSSSERYALEKAREKCREENNKICLSYIVECWEQFD